CPESRRGLGLPVDGLAAGHGKVLRTSDLLSDGTRRESAGSGRVAAGLPLQPALRALPGLDALCQLWGCPDGHYRGPAGPARDHGESRDRPRRHAHRAPAPKIAAPGLDVEAAQGLDATRSAARARGALEEISVEAPKPGPASPERTADHPDRRRRAARRFLSRLLAEHARSWNAGVRTALFRDDPGGVPQVRTGLCGVPRSATGRGGVPLLALNDAGDYLGVA